MKRPNSPPVRPVVPQVEFLEERELPVSNFRVVGNVLQIFAPTTRRPSGVNNVVIIDNGSLTSNNIIAANNGVLFRPNVPINRVLFLGDGGRDNVTYNMTGNLTSQRRVNVLLGSGDDSFRMTLREDISAPLTVSAGGSSGNDQIVMTLIGSVTGNGRITFNGTGAAGRDLLQFQTTSFVEADAGSRINFNFLGGADPDRVLVNYSGVLDGRLRFRTNGDAGNDTMKAVVILDEASTGLLDTSTVSGGANNDLLTFLVVNRSTEAISFNQFVAGDGGRDIATRTADVFQLFCEVDRLV